MIDPLQETPQREAEELVPAPAAAKEFGVTRRTLGRWFIDEKLAFPRPIEINRRLYFRRADLESWKFKRLGPPIVAA